MTVPPEKPRERWDTQDLLDYIEGWHVACDLHHRTQRDPERPTQPYIEIIENKRVARRYPDTASNFMALGRDDRSAHREATGI